MRKEDLQKIMENVSKWMKEACSHNLGDVVVDDHTVLAVKNQIHETISASLRKKRKSRVLCKYQYRVFCPKCKKTEDITLHITKASEQHILIDFGCDWVFSTEFCKFIHTACLRFHPISMLVCEYAQRQLPHTKVWGLKESDANVEL